MSRFLPLLCCLLALLVVAVIAVDQVEETEYIVEDIFIPAECESVAAPGDHVLLEYAIRFRNGSAGAYLKRPSQLFHVLLDNKVSQSPA